MKNGKKYSYEEIVELLRNSTHSAPQVWSNIEAELELNGRLNELPQYKAPEGLWDSIEAELPESTPSRPVVSRKGNNLKLLVIGFLIGALSLVSVQYLMKDNTQKYQYKSEIEMASLVSNKIEMDDKVNEVLNYIEENSFLFDKEQLIEFNTQLEEINRALEQLIEMQEKYGHDASSNKMMAKIERDRATLLKSMIANT